MTLNIAVVVGNPKPQSRTLKVAETLVEQLFAPGSYELEIIDLADHVDEIFAWPSDAMAALNNKVAESDFVVFASPTYKATYTGLLKAFLDRYPANGLQGVTAIPVLTGASELHSMGANVNLSPLLMELGASVPGRGFYFISTEMDNVEEIAREAASEYAANLKNMARLAEHTRNK